MPAVKKTAKRKPAALIGPISRIILFVTDVQGTAGWYQKIFQLQPIGVITKEWGELDAGSCSLAFHKCPSNQLNSDSHVKFCFAVADVPAARALLESRGAKMGKAHVSPSLALCDGLDPEGNRFQLSNRGV